jgi:hypothetical protein
VLIIANNLHSQNVAISEYFNVTGSANGEWVELIVLEDNVSLSGMVLRDNSGGLNNWRAGVRFTSNSLWNNLRQGTIIVINSRGSRATDISKNDGYIEVDAENSTYFTNLNGGSSLDDDGSLSYNQQDEMIELRSGSSTHHLLGHFPDINNAGNDFLNVPNNVKIAARGQLSGPSSVRVVGGDKSAYTGGFDENNTKVNIGPVSSAQVKGFPNGAVGGANSIFWRTLRQPNWNSPNLNITLQGNNLRLDWNSAESDVDNTQGYLVVQYEKTSNFNDNDLPEDSKIYQVGDAISNSSKVIAVTNSNTRTLNVPISNLDCSKDYTFRVYAYRYGKDDFGTDNTPTRARGRSYNESSFPSRQYIFEKSPDPVILSLENTTILCEGGELVLFTNNDAASYQWYFNNNIIANETSKSITVKNAGLYKIITKNSTGCEQESNVIEIRLEAQPSALIRYETRFLPDTTFYLCGSENITLTAVGGQNYTWYKDEVEISKNREIEISESGEYYFIADNSGVCKKKSRVINIIIEEFDLEVNAQVLDFGEVEFFTTGEIEIKNKSNKPLVLNRSNFIISNFFSLDQNFPVTVFSGESLMLKVRFEPTNSGEYSGILSLVSRCDDKIDIELKGIKIIRDLEVDKSIIDFGDILSCDNISKKVEQLKIKRQGILEKTILSYEFENYPEIFIIENINFPFEIITDDTFTFDIHFNLNQTGDFEDVLTFIVSDDGVTPSSEIKILIKGSYHIIDWSVENNSGNELTEFMFDNISSCEPIELGFYFVKNNSSLPILIEINDDDLFEFDVSFPLLIDSQSEVRVNYIYTPVNQFHNGEIILKSDLCEIDKRITYFSEVRGTIFSFEKNENDFGDLFYCELGSEKSEIKVNLNVLGDGQVSRVSEIKSNYFEIQGISINDELNAGDIKEVTFKLKNNLGKISEIIEINFEPCGTAFIELNANIKELNITFSQPFVDFGEIKPNEESERSFIINNNSDVNVIISDIMGLGDAFMLDLSKNNLPLTIPQNSSLEVFFKFNSDRVNTNFEKDITFILSEPCDESLMIRFFSRVGEEDRKFNVTLSVPNDLKANIIKDELLTIPISINSDEINESEFGLQRIKIIIELNFTLVSIYPSATRRALENPNLTFREPLQDSENPNKWYIELNFDRGRLNYGKVLNLVAFPTIGNSVDTEIKISYEDAVFNNNIEIISENGHFKLEGDCGTEYYMFSLFKTDINLIDGVVVDSNYELKYFSDDNVITELYLTDLLGNKIELDKRIGKGDYHSININKIPAGFYILFYNNNNKIESFRLIVK